MADTHPQHLPVVDVTTFAKFNACVHCGLCLPACPTYLVTANEADSPRGRIHLMRAAVEGRVEMSPTVLGHLDACLVCRACEVACPSGVQYHTLVEAVRPEVARAVRGRGMENALLEWVVKHIFPYPRRVAAAVAPVRVADKVGLGRIVRALAGCIGGPVAALTKMLPADGTLWPRRIPAITPAVGTRQGAVLLLQGCVGSVVSQAVNRAAVVALRHNGWEVHALGSGEERCCGAMAAHGNDLPGARQHAAAMVALLRDRPEDFFVSPIAGCGAQLKELGEVLADVPEFAAPARAVAARVRDVTEILADSLIPPAGRLEKRVAYHDPCHLLNVQKISDAPRAILAAIPGLQLVPLPESDVCCGAAGSYNLAQPAMSHELGLRKTANIVATGAEIVATANVGCQLQMIRELRDAGVNVPVRHVVELLAEAYENGHEQDAG